MNRDEGSSKSFESNWMFDDKLVVVLGRRAWALCARLGASTSEGATLSGVFTPDPGMMACYCI